MLDKNFVETDERTFGLNELHRLNKEDAEMMKKIKKSKLQHKVQWGG